MKNVQGEASNSQGEAKKASKGKQKTINNRILDYRLCMVHNLEFRIKRQNPRGQKVKALP